LRARMDVPVAYQRFVMHVLTQLIKLYILMVLVIVMILILNSTQFLKHVSVQMDFLKTMEFVKAVHQVVINVQDNLNVNLAMTLHILL